MKTITHSEIKEKMVKHHDTSEHINHRHLTIIRARNHDTDDNDTVFFKLDGYPPRGYGIFMQQPKKLILYTARGRPFEEIEDIDDVIDDSPPPTGLD